MGLCSIVMLFTSLLLVLNCKICCLCLCRFVISPNTPVPSFILQDHTSLVPTFNRDRRSHGPQHFSAALHCGFQNWPVRQNVFIGANTTLRFSLWPFRVAGRDRLIPLFCLWCNFDILVGWRENDTGTIASRRRGLLPEQRRPLC